MTDSSPVSPSPSLDSGDDEPQPMRIVATAWASSTGGTPIPSGVPEGTLPVGTRVGQVDKASYIRLSGDETMVVLNEVADGRRGSDFESSPVQACQITASGWQTGESLSFDDAPAYDAKNCTEVTFGGNGTWTIQLGQFESPADNRGFALVPSAEAPLDFQVTFSSVAAD